MGKYVITNAIAPAPSPEWIVLACGKPKERKASDNETPVEVDGGHAARRAVDYLLNHAPLAVEGAGGDHTTFTVAAKLKDFGVGEPFASIMLLAHWNDRCSPPWDPEELTIKVENAYHYGIERQGSGSPEADFTKVDPNKGLNKGLNTDLFPEPPKRPPFVIEATKFPDPSKIPKRRWLLGHHLIISKVSVTIAPPGAGKSTYSLGMGLAVITGDQNITGLKVHERGNVLIINNEDDQDEMDRRLAGSMIHHQIRKQDLEGKLFIYSGIIRPFIIAKRTVDRVVKPVDKDALLCQIRDHKIKVVIVDPFIETHQVDENNNEEINQVGRMYREIAVEADCSVLIIHHTRKQPQGTSDGHVGNMESGRGASSLAGVARVMNTLYAMSIKDATKYAISNSDRHLYVRLDDAKANLSLATHTARWYKKVSVTLPNGDEVGVLDPIELQLAVEAEQEAWLSCIQAVVADHNGEASVRKVAQFILDDPMLGQGVGIETLSSRVKSLLRTPQFVAGWELWYEVDEQRKTGTNRTAHWVYGRVAQTPENTDSNDSSEDLKGKT